MLTDSYNIILLGEEPSEKRVVEKVLEILPKRFQAKISSLEYSRDLNQITLLELVNALQHKSIRDRLGKKKLRKELSWLSRRVKLLSPVKERSKMVE